MAFTPASRQEISGNVADNAVDSGNPVKIAGIYRAAGVVHTDGNRADLLTDLRGQLKVAIGSQDSTGRAEVTGASGDALGASTVVLFTGGLAHLFNGTSWDRLRANTEATLLASAARTADTNSADQTNFNSRGVHVIINVSAGAGFSVTPLIRGKDPVSGSYYTLLQGAAIVATGLTVLKVYPGIGVAANASASDIVPRTWRVEMDHLDATSVTYSVAAAVIL